MKILIVIDTRKRPEHKKTENIYRDILGTENEICIVDMASGKPDYVIFNEIAASDSDLVITFDLAGFNLKTELNTISYNTLTCRVAHILSDMNQPGDRLDEQLNLSHFMYLPDGTDLSEFAAGHKNIPNVSVAPALGEDSIRKWFADAKKEMWL